MAGVSMIVSAPSRGIREIVYRDGVKDMVETVNNAPAVGTRTSPFQAFDGVERICLPQFLSRALEPNLG